MIIVNDIALGGFVFGKNTLCLASFGWFQGESVTPDTQVEAVSFLIEQYRKDYKNG